MLQAYAQEVQMCLQSCFGLSAPRIWSPPFVVTPHSHSLSSQLKYECKNLILLCKEEKAGVKGFFAWYLISRSPVSVQVILLSRVQFLVAQEDGRTSCHSYLSGCCEKLF